MIINTFQSKTRYSYAAFDFETKTYIDGYIVDEETIRSMCGDTHKDPTTGAEVPTFPVSWWRAHCEVRCWAWIIYTPDGLAIAETFEEWLHVIQTAGIQTGWFYNAPFDFSVLDYHMLSRGWEQVDKAKKTPRQFSELCNNFGCRYQMTICAPYERENGDRSRRASWTFTSYDLRNILHGGLEKLLSDFDVTDGDGKPIRKLTMDYQGAEGAEEDIAYMRNDAAGLWWLIHKAGAMLAARYGLDIRGRKPDVLTASGLAKRVFICRMYPTSRTYSHAMLRFRKVHPMSFELDQFLRACGLLQGGLPIVNPDYVGKLLTGLEAHRYDVNSEYPYYMSRMWSVYGRPSTFKTLDEAMRVYGRYGCYILFFSRIRACVKPDMVPSWRDPFTTKICADYRHDESRGPVAIFLEEWRELQLWYDIITADLYQVMAFPTRKENAIRDVILSEYAEKTRARESGQDVLATFPKLIMNGFGGKYSQNPHHDATRRELQEDGHVSLVCIGEDTDKNNLMQVVQGARITMAGRVMWRTYARLICGNVRQNLLYGDTDSIHSKVAAPDKYISRDRLGYLKEENKTPIVRACFLAPKTYFEEESSGKLEIHAKGVHLEEIQKLIDRGEPVEKIYTKGYRLQTLSALNVKGGKALLPLPKYITRPDLFPDENYT